MIKNKAALITFFSGGGPRPGSLVIDLPPKISLISFLRLMVVLVFTKEMYFQGIFDKKQKCFINKPVFKD